jgi:hypothetical protein
MTRCRVPGRHHSEALLRQICAYIVRLVWLCHAVHLTAAHITRHVALVWHRMGLERLRVGGGGLILCHACVRSATGEQRLEERAASVFELL